MDKVVVGFLFLSLVERPIKCLIRSVGLRNGGVEIVFRTQIRYFTVSLFVVLALVLTPLIGACIARLLVLAMLFIHMIVLDSMGNMSIAILSDCIDRSFVGFQLLAESF